MTAPRQSLRGPVKGVRTGREIAIEEGHDPPPARIGDPDSNRRPGHEIQAQVGLDSTGIGACRETNHPAPSGLALVDDRMVRHTGYRNPFVGANIDSRVVQTAMAGQIKEREMEAGGLWIAPFDAR